MGWSPTLPVLLGFFVGNLATWGEGGGVGTWVSLSVHLGTMSSGFTPERICPVVWLWHCVSSPCFPLKPRLPRRAAFMSPVQHSLSAFALLIGTFDSGISEWGDRARAPHTARRLCRWRAGYRFWWEGLPKQNSFIFSVPKPEHFIMKRIPMERQFFGNRCYSEVSVPLHATVSMENFMASPSADSFRGVEHPLCTLI